jgi:hypothetical protein
MRFKVNWKFAAFELNSGHFEIKIRQLVFLFFIFFSFILEKKINIQKRN